MSNYPPGTGPNDPDAPWNEPEAEMIDCEQCGGTGQLEEPIDGDSECPFCEGAGEVEDFGDPDNFDDFDPNDPGDDSDMDSPIEHY